MRGLCAVLLMAVGMAASDTEASSGVRGLPHLPTGWPHLPSAWPWDHHNTTTTLPPTPVGCIGEFLGGVADGLGLGAMHRCEGDALKSAADIEEIIADYKEGGIVGKAKAAEKILETAKLALADLAECATSVSDVEKLERFKREITDKRLQTVSGAVGVVLSAAEDHADLDAFESAWHSEQWSAAGKVFASSIVQILDAVEEQASGPPAIRVARGLLQGLLQAADLPCIEDARVDVELIIGGLKSLALGNVPGGVLTLLHAIADVLPMIHDCPEDRPAIAALLKNLRAMSNPLELAKTLEKNMLADRVRIAAGVAGAALAYVGKDWTRFGAVVGDLIGKLLTEEQVTTVTTTTTGGSSSPHVHMTPVIAV